MRYLFTAAVLLCAGMALASCEDGSYFDSDTKQLKSLHVGRVEATGNDLRVYEFVPQSRPDLVCIFAAGEQKAGIQCVSQKPNVVPKG